MLNGVKEQQQVICAKRFDLRPVRQSDLGFLSLFIGDERITRGVRTFVHPLPPGAIEAFIARAHAPDRVEDIWVLDGSNYGGDEALGTVSLHRVDAEQSEIYFWIAPAFWNLGYAQESLLSVLKANPHQSRCIFAESFQDNPSSARVLTNIGFDYLGDAEAYSVSRKSVAPTWTYIYKFSAA